ncbi:hypothetical protein, variant [Saprolegnia diclina VS20]|uniref:Methyltransferase domain-containing protein n=1 Tax=Saprolegnia diclina (strain VS20) TaxID=1156394 RepID=T0QTV0_SAPDV|nr:hypothetical protein, variant [Saprolegnia diclina VS20]EQC37425.1 hypothetical protein, variant [Saprolegnia diclina VS20]|eukprot:XP_008608945.1 hypothetical protein, variant [Saprolegnia diclina VS20]
MVVEAPSLAHWRTSGLSLLDLREDNEQVYVLTCDRVHIPWSAQKARCHEYPARQVAFGLLCPRDRTKAHAQVDWFLSETIRPQQLPWRHLAFFIVDATDIAAEAHALDLTGAQTPLFPQPRLWSPNALLFELVPVVAGAKAPSNAAVLDLACGSGRDVVYFAEEVLATDTPDLPHRFVGVNDNRMGRKKGLALAACRGVAKAVDFIKMDLRSVGPISQYAWGPLQCIYGCRFLNRRLFAVIRALLPVGGVVGWMQFCAPPDGSPWRWTTPSKISDILKLGELRSHFDDCFEILVDKVVLDSDHGRPMNVFIARKRMRNTTGAFLL